MGFIAEVIARMLHPYQRENYLEPILTDEILAIGYSSENN